MRTLVVDDSEPVRTLLAGLLEQRGHHVLACGDAEAGLAAHRARPFDLIVADWDLPGQSGLDLTRAVRALPGGDAVTIVVVTGKVGAGELEQVLEAGADDYLSKPQDTGMLRTRLLVAERRAALRIKRDESLAKLAHSQATFIALAESTPTGVMVVRKGHVIHVNTALVAVLGYAHPTDLLDQLVAELLPTVDGVRKAMGKGGRPIVADVVELPVIFESEPATMFIVATPDQMTAEVQTRAQLADRLALVGVLAAGIAHQLNNPLAYVDSNTHLLMEEIDRLPGAVSDTKRAALRELLEEAADGISRMRSTVRDLKTFANVDDERRGSVPLSPVVESCVTVAESELRHRAKLVIDIGPTPEVNANEARLGQVVMNLLLNAVQAIEVAGHPDQDRVSVRTFTDEDGWAVLEIEDTGGGIAPEHEARVFDPFYTTKSAREGTGLGLSTCHNIIKGVGGEITLASEYGRGTTARVRLPAARPVRRRRQSSQRAPRLAACAKVLIVDDEPLVARSLRRALSAHDVTIAGSGEEAVALLTGPEEYDIVLCDLMMPIVTGMDVYERVMAARRGYEERMVFMTGGAFTQRGRAFLDDVPNEHVEKPFDLAYIRTLVGQAVSGQP